MTRHQHTTSEIFNLLVIVDDLHCVELAIQLVFHLTNTSITSLTEFFHKVKIP